jgi:hypothetical protein
VVSFGIPCRFMASLLARRRACLVVGAQRAGRDGIACAGARPASEKRQNPKSTLSAGAPED